ncbi:AlpA family transcriptional regulator [Streptomyces sp. V3I7]|uniref:helix-turn-helix transcriptional regulator n=1 Tax=Streptomyces sp. V3I7 TaxID=3042278 RepID=UPI00278935B6|nr:hypothetical protein [Streptomyces sp. V3I7]MDQ0994797.1 putative DNA-binding transcriptional regulator AlpA [Streptomyces sp. V3I7]
MTSHGEPRLADSAEIAAEQGLTPARINTLYKERAENGFPEAVSRRGRARLWDHAEVSKWFADRTSAIREYTPPTLDPEELLNAAEASRFLGYKNPGQVKSYVRDHPGYFPEPDEVEELGTPESPYRRQKWRVQTLLNWQANRPGPGRRSVERPTPPLPDVPVDGDLDELLGATQAAALLGFKSVNSFSSSLGQGNLPLLKTTDGVNERGHRRWTRRRVLEQAAARRSRT